MMNRTSLTILLVALEFTFVCSTTNLTCPKFYTLSDDRSMCLRNFKKYSTFDQATRICNNDRAIIVEPRSFEKYTAVGRFHGRNNKEFWIGTTDRESEGHYVWCSDQTPLSQTINFWLTLHSHSIYKNCAVMNTFDNGWKRVSCATRKWTICQTKGSCRSGYKQVDDKNCEDIDECLMTKNICGVHACQNIEGSYKCKCKTGYKQIDDKNCEDIDECLMNKTKCDLHTKCHNLEGSYTCNCINSSFIKDEQLHFCYEDIQPNVPKTNVLDIFYHKEIVVRTLVRPYPTVVIIFFIYVIVCDIYTICKALYWHITTKPAPGNQPFRKNCCVRCGKILKQQPKPESSPKRSSSADMSGFIKHNLTQESGISDTRRKHGTETNSGVSAKNIREPNKGTPSWFMFLFDPLAHRVPSKSSKNSSKLGSSYTSYNGTSYKGTSNKGTSYKGTSYKGARKKSQSSWSELRKIESITNESNGSVRIKSPINKGVLKFENLKVFLGKEGASTESLTNKSLKNSTASVEEYRFV